MQFEEWKQKTIPIRSNIAYIGKQCVCEQTVAGGIGGYVSQRGDNRVTPLRDDTTIYIPAARTANSQPEIADASLHADAAGPTVLVYFITKVESGFFPSRNRVCARFLRNFDTGSEKHFLLEL
jgi:hypothetical protein